MDTIRFTISEISGCGLMGGSDEVHIFVNGNNLCNRLDSRMLGPPPEVVFLPSRHLLGRPHPWFSHGEKAVLYTAPGCGMDGCERILVKVIVDGDRVAWSGFERQIAMRPAGPNISPRLRFTFDRRQYEKELSRRYTIKNELYLERISR